MPVENGEGTMRILILAILSMILLSSCSMTDPAEKKDDVIQIGKNQAFDIPFEEGAGRVTVIYQNGVVDFNLLAKELDQEESFEVNLNVDGQTAVIFGPEGNMRIQLGKMTGETLFQANEQGELVISMLNPERIVQAEEDARIIIRNSKGEIVKQTSPFILVN